MHFIDFEAENVTPEIRKSLKQLFATGKVWLLLDGVDEMAASSPIEALARIREQLIDWVGKARVVLTCRLNVWDAAIRNMVTDFDTFDTHHRLRRMGILGSPSPLTLESLRSLAPR
ncbi:MAG: hypothetical protein U7127_17920 [Phormidium sp.]